MSKYDEEYEEYEEYEDNEIENDVWSNEIQEDDDEETIKLKQRLNRASFELEKAQEEQEKYQEKNKKRSKAFAFNKENTTKEKKHSSLVVNSNAKGLARFGYDEEAHENMKMGKGYTESMIENPRTRMVLYIGFSILCVSLIVVKFIFF